MGKPESSFHQHAEVIGSIARGARLFLSMPFVEGLTPRVLKDGEGTEAYSSPEPLERRHGVFRIDEAGLAVFDHGALYGDSIFEGVLIVDGRLFVWKEHLERLWAGARKLGIDMPYDPVELTLQVARTAREVGGDLKRSYVRLVVSRGLGDLGIHPGKCLGSTVYAVVATIQLYPEELYERGIEVSVARRVRRPGADVLDPTVKSSNYLNNILALVETLAGGRPETLMLTQQGHLAEATADNAFLIERRSGWEEDSGRVVLHTPPVGHCLEGITRALILDAARELGYEVHETATLLTTDLVGEGREVFLTGTGAGIIPVVAVGDHAVGDGAPGPVTWQLRRKLLDAMADPALGLRVTATREEVEHYLDTASWKTT